MDIPVYGDHVTFNPLVVTFKVDEDLKNYFEIHSWMSALGNAYDQANFKALAANPQYTGIGLKSEILLTILGSARRSNFNVTFYDAFPVSLSDLVFHAAAQDLATVTASVPLRWRRTRLEVAAPVVCGHMAAHFSASHAVVEEAAIGAALGTASGRLSESRLCL
jgi:hypothetical protein